MERWTIKDLNNISDIGFAIRILNERRTKLNPFSPLASKRGPPRTGQQKAIFP